MDTKKQIDDIVSILMDLDNAEEMNDNNEISNKTKELESILNTMLANKEIYGDLKDILIQIQADYLSGNKLHYGLLAADIGFYLY